MLPLFALLAGCACLSLTATAAEPPLTARVRDLLAALSLDEKLKLTEGGHDPHYLGQAGYVEGVPRLNVPALRLADGPAGILNRFDTTALPQVIALAATFDANLSRRYGTVLGNEARATGMDVVLGPMVNIARVPNWGRNITSFGEDPLLTSVLVQPEIWGIQAEGAMATTKHFLANNQSEHQGGGLANDPGYDFNVDARTLHEIYLPGFEAAVQAGSASMMAAYNHLNGLWNTQNAATLSGVLRDELGWNGFMMSDWHANHATDSIKAGLDMEMPGAGPVGVVGEPPFWGERLKAAIEAGQVQEKVLDQAVGRILTQMERLGMLDGNRKPAPQSIDVAAHAEIARQIATQGAVLLKNDGLLPLAKTADLVLIGPTARQLAVGPGAGRSEGFPARLVAPLQALRQQLGHDFKFAVGDELEGHVITEDAVRTSSGRRGFERHAVDGTPDRIDSSIDFTGPRALPAGQQYRWRATLQVAESGEYLLSTQSWGGSTELLVDGAVKASSARLAFGNGVPHRLSSLLPTLDGLDNGQVFLHLEKSKSYQIELDAVAEVDSTMQLRLSWVTPEERRRNRAEAVALARSADIAVVFAWARGGEGFDASQSLALPYEQDELIDEVAAVNPKTIVVLNTGNPISMPWRDKVKAVLEMWFPGQEGGWATADLLLGQAVPAGRLPFTFPANAADTPALAPEHPERTGKNGSPVVYSEGIYVGYRYYDQFVKQPLYCFGYGLSYTKFDYSHLEVKRVTGGLDVAFEVRNSGALRAIDTPQVYVTAPQSAPLPMAKHALAGFARLELNPGESRRVKVLVHNQQMSVWSPERAAWMLPSGQRDVILAHDVCATADAQGALRLGINVH
jgi:beta-glucosidase